MRFFTFLPSACCVTDPAAKQKRQLSTTLNRTAVIYDADRRQTRITRPDGATLDFAYDAAGRPSTLNLPGGEISYAYDAATGQLSEIVTFDGNTLTYSYDGSLLTAETWSGTVAGTVSRTYDNNFRVASVSVNGDNTISFEYDDDNLLIRSGDLLQTRDPRNGLLLGSTLGNVTDAWEYTGFGEPVRYNAAYQGTTVYSVENGYDKLGRITQKTETIQGVTDRYQYVYDPAGRLIEVRKNDLTVAFYTYDSNGNRLSYTGPVGVTIDGTYDDQDRLVQYGSAAFRYAPNGELFSKIEGDQTSSYHYDPLGNLSSVVLPDATTIEYLVDGENRRVAKKLNGVVVQSFLYQCWLNPVAELDADDNVVSLFVYGSHRNVPEYMVKGGFTYRIISDHLGSPRLVVNAETGEIAQRMDYDEFGRVLTDTNSGFQPFGFAGGLYDPDTGLTRFGFRDYDAETGRWTAKDPIRFSSRGMNLYEYVLNDPVNVVDVIGLQPGRPGFWDVMKPDYHGFEIGYGLGIVSIMWDRYGNLYLGGGGETEGAKTGKFAVQYKMGYSMSIRWKERAPTPEEMEKIMTGPSFSVAGAFITGVGFQKELGGDPNWSLEGVFGFGVGGGVTASEKVDPERPSPVAPVGPVDTQHHWMDSDYGYVGPYHYYPPRR